MVEKRPVLATMIFSICLLACAGLIGFGATQASQLSSSNMVLSPIPGLILFLCILAAAPFAYGKTNAGERRVRVIRDAIWIAWLVITALVACFYAEVFEPGNSILDDSDAPEPDRASDEFFRDRIVPYYGNLLALTILIGLPAFIYWFRRLTLKGSR
jgi:amino acid transporter